MNELQTLVNLLYPPACPLCRAALSSSDTVPHDGPPLCGACAARLAPLEAPVCARCGIDLAGAFDAVMTCMPCRGARPSFDMARSPWRYTGVVRQAVRQFKYHRRWRIGRWLADGMARAAGSSLPLGQVDAVLPVPLHRLKRRLNGFDAVDRLARTLARGLEKPYLPGALRRRRWTATQTRLPTRARARNVRGAFAARPEQVRGRSVLLVDDVLTSGATAEACALALRRAGARRVFVLTAAHTPQYRARGTGNGARGRKYLTPFPTPPAPQS